MSDAEHLVVSVWKKLPKLPSGWGKAGELHTWTRIDLEPRFLQAGPWSLTMPYNDQALKVMKDRLLTFDYRGMRVMTGQIDDLSPQSDENGRPVLTVSGVDVIGRLGGVSGWPVPANAVGNQTTAQYVASGAAETVLRQLVRANMVDRLGSDVVLAPDQGRGGSVRVRLHFANLLEVLAKKAELGGLGVRLGLVNTTGTRAQLRLEFYVPRDRTKPVRLSHKVGTLRSWAHHDVAPTATRAIIAGAGEGTTQVMAQVIDHDAEAAWGRVIETYVDARDTFDVAELEERGREALNEGTGEASFTLETTDAEGMRYGVHYYQGDRVSVALLTGVTAQDVIRAVRVTADDTGTHVSPVVGNPDGGDPLFRQAAILRGLRREVRALQRSTTPSASA